jgi:hypothetical protein
MTTSIKSLPMTRLASPVTAILLHRLGQRACAVGLGGVALFLIGNVDGLDRVRQVEFGDGADLNTIHVRDAGDDVGAHLARPDQADANRLA